MLVAAVAVNQVGVDWIKSRGLHQQLTDTGQLNREGLMGLLPDMSLDLAKIFVLMLAN